MHTLEVYLSSLFRPKICELASAKLIGQIEFVSITGILPHHTNTIADWKSMSVLGIHIAQYCLYLQLHPKDPWHWLAKKFRHFWLQWYLHDWLQVQGVASWRKFAYAHAPTSKGPPLMVKVSCLTGFISCFTSSIAAIILLCCSSIPFSVPSTLFEWSCIGWRWKGSPCTACTCTTCTGLLGTLDLRIPWWQWASCTFDYHCMCPTLTVLFQYWKTAESEELDKDSDESEVDDNEFRMCWRNANVLSRPLSWYLQMYSQSNALHGLSGLYLCRPGSPYGHGIWKWKGL